MKRKLAIATTVLLIAAVSLSVFYANGYFSPPTQHRPFYVGVEYAYANDTAPLKALVDKVKDYTNLFVIGSPAISFNRTALDESCDYITQSDLNFIVLFTGLDQYNWLDNYKITDWMVDAQQKYGEKFLESTKSMNPAETSSTKAYPQ